MGKFLFFDVDGTLISPTTGHIPQSAVNAINKAKDNGHKCFICTGRSYHLAIAYQQEVYIPGVVFCNGGGIASEGSIKYTQNIRRDTMYHLMDMVNWLGGEFRLLTKDRIYLNEKAYINDAKRWENTFGLPSKQLYENMGVSFMSEYKGEPVQKMDVCFSSGLIADVFFSRVPEDICLVKDGGYFTGMGNLAGELTAAGVTKATGVQTVLDMYGADLCDSYVFGDSCNDISMLKMCPNSTAMGNGSEEVKKAAAFVTTHCDDDVIANAMKHFGLIG